ncbi:uncharacterized protein [Choristoneura fumiferana]|uniref:uncharacterized protein n=1 Tax=Choristoneura fumiferana TaxID=7141 RepID=UPI003D1538BF
MELLKVEETEELQACRICLATDTELYSILEHRLENAFVEIMGTMLSAWDGFPQHVCAWCRRLLRKSAEFRARGRRAHDALARLARSQALTTECVRSVDRAALRLPLPLASVAAAPALCCWHELKQEAPEPEVPLKEEEVLLEHYTDGAESDHMSLKYEDDSADDVALSQLRAAAKPNRKKQLRKNKVKKVKAEKKERRKTEKIRDEDFPAFEREYNIDVVVLTHDQQVEDMAARKGRDNYMNSLFKCDLCFKGFYTEATLKNHHVKHHDESVGPHECSLCRCRFRIPAILRRHAETHRLRFVCQHCGFTARDRSHAMTHSKEHKGLRYECQYCGDSFKKRSTYGTHVRIQHPSQNKSCDVCGETFLGALGLALHKKKTHRQVTPKPPHLHITHTHLDRKTHRQVTPKPPHLHITHTHLDRKTHRQVTPHLNIAHLDRKTHRHVRPKPQNRCCSNAGRGRGAGAGGAGRGALRPVRGAVRE